MTIDSFKDVKNKTEFLVFALLWASIFLLVNFSGWINTVGVFHSTDGSLLIPSIYGAVFNAILFFGNANYLMTRWLLRRKVGTYLILFCSGFILISLLESWMDAMYYHNYYEIRVDYGEVIIGNLVIDLFFIITPSFLYRFGKDWFHSDVPISDLIEQTASHKVLSIKSGHSVHQVPINTITYIESDGNYVKFHTTDKAILARESLSKQEQVLDAHNFVRCHKSFIVARHHVNRITADSLFILNTEIPVGRSYKESVKAFFDS